MSQRSRREYPISQLANRKMWRRQSTLLRRTFYHTMTASGRNSATCQPEADRRLSDALSTIQASIITSRQNNGARPTAPIMIGPIRRLSGFRHGVLPRMIEVPLDKLLDMFMIEEIVCGCSRPFMYFLVSKRRSQIQHSLKFSSE